MDNPKVQCRTCSWRRGATTDAIPGYVREKHEALCDTIAQPGELRFGRGLRVMACHHSVEGEEHPCVGWAVQQLGEGNNLALRLAALTDPRLQGLRTVGPQRATFGETFASGRRRRDE
jgi:hypothetical protein